jgi:hypothetical protein
MSESAETVKQLLSFTGSTDSPLIGLRSFDPLSERDHLPTNAAHVLMNSPLMRGESGICRFNFSEFFDIIVSNSWDVGIRQPFQQQN